MLFKTISIFAALSLATLAAPAYAFEHSTSIASQEVVGYSDLNIESAPGATALLNRIKRAARRVCGPRPDVRDLQDTQFFESCIAGATTQAVAAVGNPLVTHLFGGNNETALMAVRN